MAQPVIWSQESLDDADAIAAYIHRNSPFYAQHVVEELFSLADSIAEQPKIGRVVPELKNENVRERFIYSYRLIYELREDQIEILAVIHGRRLLESIENRFQ
ncbi:MAG: type II toxin-antitoxin system RelE/ParE family toxin [Pseudomonadota bacterium]